MLLTRRPLIERYLLLLKVGSGRYTLSMRVFSISKL